MRRRAGERPGSVLSAAGHHSSLRRSRRCGRPGERVEFPRFGPPARRSGRAFPRSTSAIRSGGGEQAVFEILHRARELYRNRLQTDAAADELASLFAECAIAEAQGPARSSNNPPLAPLHVGPSIPLDSEGRSFLAMSGRQQVMLDAFADGSSFVCLKCGGLVSTNRKDEHFAYWCS
ncbi:uncharacterized protein LOC122036707 isoform X2 [Zingiber officinale]|uniref:uncharacterized protein LOC122036707 isoform X2 n=1 Tax=Zingiber officinale TaxID=94328 RepID=UPI001C4B1A10|nr:uncharacterized protein LOC122036707 isoform X2 [Zingiber officinale]